MLQLILSRDWTAGRQAVLSRIAGDIRGKKPGRILMVPELISHDTERRLSAVAGDTASRYAQVLSFSRLARRICDLRGSAAVECLDNGGRLVAMAAAAQSLHSRLKTYAAVETKPEFLTSVVDAVDEFKRCCISAADLKAASERAEGSLAQKLEELSLLLECYDSLCAQGKRDPRDQMNWVLEQLQEMDFAENHVLYVDGFPDLTRQHMAVLGHFIIHCPLVVVSLNCDQPDSHDLCFEKAGQTAKELLSIARQAGVEVQLQYIQEDDTPMHLVRSRLFQGSTAQAPELEGSLYLHQLTSQHQECQTAAQRILELVHGGCRYRDISLVCSDMAAYQPVLQLVFGRAGIPMYISGTEAVLDFGVVATVIFALEAALGGFEQKAVLRYLRSSLSPLDENTCDLVENYAYIWRIDRKTWKENWKFHPQGLSGQWDEVSCGQLQLLNDARALAMEPLARLEQGFGQAKCLKDQVLCLYRFLEETAFAEKIAALAEASDAAGDNRSAQIYDQLWDILVSSLEQLHDVLADTVWEPEAFVKLLKLLLSQYDVGAIPPVLDAVSVGPVSAQRCQQAKHLILLGANEGELPGYGGAAGLLNDQERVQLRSLGLPLTGGSVEGLQAEFAEIYGVFCGAEETITVCCSQQPSFLFQRLAKLAGRVDAQPCAQFCVTADPVSAGACLARWEAQETAQELGILQEYLDVLYRRSYEMGCLEPQTVRSLYGQQLSLSASQVDKQATCRLSYFLQYGLAARERKEATVDPAEFGTYVHAVLEKTVSQVMQMGGFHQVDLETTLSIAQTHSENYLKEYFGLLDSQRLQYLFRRNMQELEMVVQELWRELSQAQYEPQETELQFGFGGQMPAIEFSGTDMQGRLRGFVDRVDSWQKGGSSYFRVVDYKTGKKDFDYCDVYNGVGLQMLLYLFAMEEGGELLGKDRVPAGVQYFPARAPYVSAQSDLSQEEAMAAHRKQWKRAGLLLSDEASLEAMDPALETLGCKKKKDGTLSGDLADRQQLGQLKDYVYGLLGRMADRISSGDVTPDPYTRGTSFDACTFCPYGAVCHKDTVQGRRNYKAMSAQEFWDGLGKEDTHG